jgi:hypothetical protein
MFRSVSWPSLSSAPPPPSTQHPRSPSVRLNATMVASADAGIAWTATPVEAAMVFEASSSHVTWVVAAQCQAEFGPRVRSAPDVRASGFPAEAEEDMDDDAAAFATCLATPSEAATTDARAELGIGGGNPTTTSVSRWADWVRRIRRRRHLARIEAMLGGAD